MSVDGDRHRSAVSHLAALSRMIDLEATEFDDAFAYLDDMPGRLRAAADLIEAEYAEAQCYLWGARVPDATREKMRTASERLYAKPTY